MNDFERQERRARSRLSIKAVFGSALVSGLLVFFIPGGGPWTSNETGIAVMGRILSASWLTAVIYQLMMALGYGAMLAILTFRLTLLVGIIVGALLSIPLFGLNALFVKPFSLGSANEVHVFLAHLFFCLLFTAQYRAMAVPTMAELEAHHPHRPPHAAK